MTLDFRPPKENRWILRFSQAVLPMAMARVRGIVAVSLAKTDWAHLESLRGGRAILSANHPTTSDPLIAMYLSRRLGEPFNYMACRELFHGAWGWTIQRLGAYSIHRGLPEGDLVEGSGGGVAGVAHVPAGHHPRMKMGRGCRISP